MIRTFKEMKANRHPVSCIHDTAVGFLIILLQEGYSTIQLSSVLSIGGNVLGRLREEMTDIQLYGKDIGSKNSVPYFY